MKKILLILLLLLPSMAWAKPHPIEGTWRLDPERSSGISGPLGDRDQSLQIKAQSASEFQVKITARKGSWTGQDFYRADGKPTSIDMVIPDGSKLSGARRCTWTKDKQGLEVHENLQLGIFPAQRDATIRLAPDAQSLIIDAVETSPMGKKKTRRVYVKAESANSAKSSS